MTRIIIMDLNIYILIQLTILEFIFETSNIIFKIEMTNSKCKY